MRCIIHGDTDTFVRVTEDGEKEYCKKCATMKPNTDYAQLQARQIKRANENKKDGGKPDIPFIDQ